MVSLHLQAERDRLLSEIERIRQSGPVAPPNIWIGPNLHTKGKKTYEYLKLNSENPQVRHLHLGKAGSEKHRDWLARIARRNAVGELEAQLAMLLALMDRQAQL